MPKISKTYKRNISSAFLSVYLAFILIGTIHYHCYDLNPRNSINNEVSSDGQTDLNSDFFSVCSLHQFSQSISNTSYTSDDIVQSLFAIETNLSKLNQRAPSAGIYSDTSPRAPPANS